MKFSLKKKVFINEKKLLKLFLQNYPSPYLARVHQPVGKLPYKTSISTALGNKWHNWIWFHIFLVCGITADIPTFLSTQTWITYVPFVATSQKEDSPVFNTKLIQRGQWQCQCRSCFTSRSSGACRRQQCSTQPIIKPSQPLSWRTSEPRLTGRNKTSEQTLWPKLPTAQAIKVLEPNLEVKGLLTQGDRISCFPLQWAEDNIEQQANKVKVTNTTGKCPEVSLNI